MNTQSHKHTEKGDSKQREGEHFFTSHMVYLQSYSAIMNDLRIKFMKANLLIW